MLSEATIDGLVGILSRFLSWFMPRHIQINPAFNIDPTKRPQRTSKVADAPWIEDDRSQRWIMTSLSDDLRQGAGIEADNPSGN
jgi:hypothetical protein